MMAPDEEGMWCAARSDIAETSSGLKRFVPLLAWLPKYDRSGLGFDIIAGLTLWGLVVPEAMAYAGIAGLPPQAGLYTLIASMLIYAIFGTSRHLSLGGTSAAAALLASSVAAVFAASAAADASDPATYQAYAAAFVLVVGLVFFAAGLARMGYITQFLSKPVMEGFVVGLATFVAVGQLYKLFGVPRPEGNTIEKLFQTLGGLPEANWATFATGAVALALLFLLPLLSKKIPAGLVVLFGAIGVSSALDLAGKYGVEVVGTLPGGLPSVSLPQVPLADYLGMVLPAIGVLLVVFSESLGTANEFAHEARLRGRRRPRAERTRLREPGERALRRHARRREHVGVGGQGRRRRTHAGEQSRDVGRDGSDPAVPHAALRDASRGRPGRADHPRGLAHSRLAQAARASGRKRRSRSGSASWRWRACCSSTSWRACSSACWPRSSS